MIRKCTFGAGLVAAFSAGVFICSIALAGTGEVASAITRSGVDRAVYSSAPRDSSKVVADCQVDGATIGTAMAAFESQNPGVVPTKARLQSNSDGGPYIQGWGAIPPFYTFSISATGRLLVAIPSGEQPVSYTGPSVCQKLQGVTLEKISIVAACEADGATIATAVAAFEAQNPGVVPTESRLLSKKDGGPYIRRWAHNPPYYAYSLASSGRLLVSIPANSTAVRYTGPAQCEPLL